MTTYILRRLLLVPVTLFIVSFGTAMIMRLTPADVVDYRLQNSYNPERADALREQLGLNKGPFEAYYDWISNAFQGDFGRSFISYTPIVDEVKRRFPVTIQLVLLTVLVQAFIAIPLGALAAVRQNGLTDHAIRIISVIVIAVPSFVLAVFALRFPPLWWGWLPPLGYVSFQDDPLRNMLLYATPVAVGALGLMATLIRLTRTEMLEVLRQDYVRTARAKGLKQMHSGATARAQERADTSRNGAWPLVRERTWRGRHHRGDLQPAGAGPVRAWLRFARKTIWSCRRSSSSPDSCS